MEIFAFIFITGLALLAIIIGANDKDPYLLGIGIIVICFSFYVLGTTHGEDIGEREASKQCQLEECPYIIQDSTQIYLEKQ